MSSKFYDAIKGKCNESTNERIRQWFESGSADDGVLGRYVIAQKQAKLALAVAVAAKAIWIKIPKVGDDRKKEKELVAATKSTSRRPRSTRLFVLLFACTCPMCLEQCGVASV